MNRSRSAGHGSIWIKLDIIQPDIHRYPYPARYSRAQSQLLWAYGSAERPSIQTNHTMIVLGAFFSSRDIFPSLLAV